MKFLSLWVVFLCLMCVCHSMDRHRNKICYKAMTCIHTGREKCGSDGKGSNRRFYDSCDLLEYNCLKGTSYAKAPNDRCSHLPPMKEGPSQNNNEVSNGQNKDISGNEQGGMAGTININDNGDIEGTIEISDDLLEGGDNEEQNYNNGNEKGGPSYNNGDENGINGNIVIDDDGGVEGTIEIDDDLLENVVDEPQDEPGYEPNSYPVNAGNDGDGDYLEGEMEIDDKDVLGQNENKGVKGEVMIDDDGNVEATLEYYSEYDAQGGYDEELEGEIEIDDEEIEGRIESAAKSE